MLLALLADRPRNGYELMGELARLFGPAYRPSAGSVYPAITALRAEKLIRATGREDKNTYVLTKAGQDALARRQEMLAEIELRTGARLRAEDGLAPLLERFSRRVGRCSGLVAADEVASVLDEAAGAIERLATTTEVRHDG